MKRIAILFPIVFALAVCLFGEEPAKAPTITDAHRAEFFKRQLTFNQASQAYQNAQAGLQGAVAEMSKDCGDKFRPQIDPQSGDPVCVAIPEKPAAPAKK